MRRRNPTSLTAVIMSSKLRVPGYGKGGRWHAPSQPPPQRNGLGAFAVLRRWSRDAHWWPRSGSAVKRQGWLESQGRVEDAPASCWSHGKTLSLRPWPFLSATILRRCTSHAPGSYLSRTCLVPPMWIAIHMGGTRQVRDRYEGGTPLIHHRTMGGAPWRLPGALLTKPADPGCFARMRSSSPSLRRVAQALRWSERRRER